MTKHKIFTYSLLSCVALVWGIVFYQVYATMAQEEEPVALVQKNKILYVKLINHEDDSVKLALNYRNPFAPNGDGDVTIASASPVNTVKVIQSDQKIKTKVNWSNILYSGYINNPSNKQKIGIISMNGTSLMLAEGQTSNGLKLLKLMKDSAQLRYEKEIKYIKLK